MATALFPGSFDPPTNGHVNILARAASIFDHVHVVIAANPSKGYTFSTEERVIMMTELTSEHRNASVHTWDSLIVDFAREVGARVMVRGVRALSDFAYEFELSMMNRGLNPEVETLFMPTEADYFVLRSSAIKELARLGGDVSGMVPPIVASMLARKLAG